VGHAGEVKLKELFQKARIPLWERRKWPIMTSGRDIVWALRFGPAAEYAASAGSWSILAVEAVGVSAAEPGVTEAGANV
jgi:tRNA(Ile)-lysidine synthetase-like protein